MTVGHATISLTDDSRDVRTLTTEVWYPASDSIAASSGVPTRYELLPGVGFDSPTAIEGANPASGRHPVVVWSHGRTGLRHIYTKMCEGLATNGFVVVSADHAGDTLFDWLTGANVDDETNERQRLGDVSVLIDAVFDGRLGAALASVVDPQRVFVAGHSYGGLTAIVSTTGVHGLPGDPRVRAVAGVQAYTRTLPGDLIDAINVPTMLVVGMCDLTTPPSTDADPIWARLSSLANQHQRVDLPDGGHQACSDFSYYMEVLPTIPDVPQIVVDYLQSIAAESPPGFASTWRTTLEAQISAISGFFAAV